MKQLILKSLLFFCAFFFISNVQAQDLTVSGTVRDVTGPLPGANITVKGTSNGTTTDFDGNYVLTNVPPDAILIYSFVGYYTQEIGVNGRTTINVNLEVDAAELEQVVVIGYGQTTIKDATGAVSAVTAEDFNRGVIASPEELIQGKVAGVQISQASGEPGAGVAFRIRGTNSIRANNNPLFVVDGVPLSGGDTSAGGGDIGFGSSSARNPLNFLNPNDIESISVLKDASATAIYGSRGANGVVIITTKSGRGVQGTTIEYNYSASFARAAERFDLLNREEYLRETERFGIDVAERDFGADTDWQDYVLRDAIATTQNLAYNYNYSTGSIRATLGYTNQEGVIEKSGLERITGRLNLRQRLFDDKLTLGLQTTLSRVNDRSAPLSGSAGFQGDLLGAAYSANPTWPTDPDFEGTGGLLSPATFLRYTQIEGQTDRALVNFSAEYFLTDAFSAKVNLGYDKSDSRSSAVASSLGRNLGQGTFGNGNGRVDDLELENRLIEVTLNYNKELGNSRLEGLLGYSFQDFRAWGRNLNGFNFNTTDMDQMVDDILRTADIFESNITGSYQQYGFAPNLDNAFVNRLFPEPGTDRFAAPAGLPVGSFFADTFDNTDKLQSFFGRINYNLLEKYIFTATIRADGSSRFGENNQYGYFPSGAFAWQIANEDFVGEAISTLKLRLGAGITGNQEGLGYGNFVRRERFGGGDIIGDGGQIDNIPGASAVAFANPDLKWEETLQYGIGLDFGFNNDRFNGSIDVYRKETTDLLFRVFSAQPAVQPFIFLNLPDSEVVNQGVELALNYSFINRENFAWDMNFNVSYNENEITSLAGEFEAGTIRGQGLSNAFAQKLAEGQPLFSYFLRDFEGFDPETGEPIQEDVQRFVGKSALPDWTGGLSTSLQYYNWNFNMYFNGQFGNYIYNNTANAFFTAGAFRGGRNVPAEVLQTGESLDAAAEVSTRFLERGDFVRLQSATLSYDLPLRNDGYNYIKSVRLSLTGQNLFVITDYSGLDPEISVTPGAGDLLNGLPVFGIDYTAYPRPRTFTLGINATF